MKSCHIIAKHGKKIRGRFRACKTGFKAAKGSHRWVKSGKAWVLIGCPVGKWRKGRCSVGTRAVEILKKEKRR